MPIKPENKHRYPKAWPLIRQRIAARAHFRCEQCHVPNYAFRNNATGAWTNNVMQADDWALLDGDKVTRIVCTVAHLDHMPEHCEDNNLRYLCQRCHLAYDAEHHQQTAYMTRREGKAIDMFAPRA